MSYLVLARKWRPTQFDEVIGQEHVARTLKNAIEQDRVAHSFLFTGARGVGKTSTARILAKALNCESSQDSTATPCGTCNSCVAITDGQSVDVFEIDGASNRGINEIRELRESVRYAPSRARNKIYIIDEVHMLTTEAFNALLKTLEEPPPHAKFIFATTEPQKIPVTILSRCQRYDFKRIGLQAIIEYLELLCQKEGIQAERAALQVIARQAAGGMRDALSLLDQVISFAGTTITESQVAEILGVANRRHLFELSAAVLGSNAGAALVALDDVNQYGYDLQQFSSELVRHFRDLMVISVVEDPTRVTDLTESEIAAARAQVGAADPTVLHRAFSILSACTLEMARSSFPKMVLEMALLRLARLEPLVGLDTMLDRLSILEASFDEDLPPVDLSSTTAPRRVAQPSVQPAVPKPSVPAVEPSRAPAETSTRELQQATPVEAKSPPIAEVSTPVAKAPVAKAEPEPEPQPSSVVEPKTLAPQPTPAPKPTPAPEPEPRQPANASAASNSPPPGHPAYIEPKPGDQIIKAREPSQPVVKPAPKAESKAPERAPTAPTPQRQPEPKPSRPKPVESVSKPVPERAQKVAPAPKEAPKKSPTDVAREVPVIVRLAPDEIAAMSATQRWQAVVDAVRGYNLPLAATCEHAYVERFEDGRVELSFSDKYLDFIHAEGRVKRVEETVKSLFGQKYGLTIETRSGESGDDLTIAEARDVKLDKRRQNLKEEVLNNPVVKQAQELFDVDSDSVRVQVKLFDDP